jgi:U3 small nucleolar RNA-associated protein 14
MQAKQKRKDGSLDHVVINEQRDKGFTKYTVKDLPYPYHSVKEFEMVQAIPLGAEWNTACTHKRLIQPATVKKSGQLILPIKYSKDIPAATLDALSAMRKHPKRAPAKF